MSCLTSTCLKNIHSINQDLLLNIIEANLKMFLDWSFLKIGGWIDVDRPSNSLYGNELYRLSVANDPSYISGSAWDALKKDWVWEGDNILFDSRSPTAINGIFVNNQFISNTSNTYYIDYPNGRIVFNTPISTDSIVEVEYSYRYIQVYRANDSEWFLTVQYPDPNNRAITRLESGDWKIGQNNTIQLPAIVIESIPRSRSRPYEIGSGGLVIEQDFAFHILANNKNDRNKLIDILRLQQDLTISLYDTNALSADDKYPLNYNGSLKTEPLIYPLIIDQYKWKKCWLKNINVFEAESLDPNMHRATVRTTAEIIYT